MNDMVDVTIPVDPGAAKALDSPLRRQAAGRVLSDLLSGRHVSELVAEAIAGLKQEARESGLTDDEIDAELAAWRSERRA